MNKEITNIVRVKAAKSPRIRNDTESESRDEIANLPDETDAKISPHDLTRRRQTLWDINGGAYDITGKVIILGDSGVGKTCFLLRFRDGLFLSGSYMTTLGMDCRVMDCFSLVFIK